MQRGLTKYVFKKLIPALQHAKCVGLVCNGFKIGLMKDKIAG
jgi:hypothetical protein